MKPRRRGRLIQVLPRVEYTPTGTVHSVHASGGPEDGSLHDFFTLCLRHVLGDTGADGNKWRETKRPPTCQNCARSSYWRRG